MGPGFESPMVHQKTPYGNVGRFFLCLRLWESSAWCRRGREQHVRAVSVPPGSNSPVDCWKVRGSLRGLISQKGDCPYPFGGAHAPCKRLHSPRGDRSHHTEKSERILLQMRSDLFFVDVLRKLRLHSIMSQNLWVLTRRLLKGQGGSLSPFL